MHRPNLRSGKFGAPILSTEIYGYDGAAGDFKGDGLADLFTSSSGSFSVYLNREEAKISFDSSTLIDGDIGVSITAGDFFVGGKTHAAMLSGDQSSTRRLVDISIFLKAPAMEPSHSQIDFPPVAIRLRSQTASLAMTADRTSSLRIAVFGLVSGSRFI